MADDWGAYDRLARNFHRTRATISRATAKLADDTGPVRLWQIEGYPTELRDKVQQLGEFGHGAMPLPGAKAHVTWHGGYRGFGTLTTIADPRYPVKGYKGGESYGYMVDGAGNDGSGGSLRKLYEGLLGWVHNIFGKTINIGTAADTATITVKGDTITVTGTTKVTVTAPEVDISNGGAVQAVKLADGSNSTVLKAQ